MPLSLYTIHRIAQRVYYFIIVYDVGSVGGGVAMLLCCGVAELRSFGVFRILLSILLWNQDLAIVIVGGGNHIKYL